MAEDLLARLPVEARALGAHRASCGPAERGTADYFWIGGLTALAGIGCFVAPLFIHGKTPTDEAGANAVFALFGVSCLLLGGGVAVAPLWARQQLHVFADGFVREHGGDVAVFVWADVASVEVIEDFYENRFAKPKRVVIVRTHDGDRIRMTSAYEGDGEAVSRALAAIGPSAAPASPPAADNPLAPGHAEPPPLADARVGASPAPEAPPTPLTPTGRALRVLLGAPLTLVGGLFVLVALKLTVVDGVSKGATNVLAHLMTLALFAAPTAFGAWLVRRGARG